MCSKMKVEVMEYALKEYLFDECASDKFELLRCHGEYSMPCFLQELFWFVSYFITSRERGKRAGTFQIQTYILFESN